MKSRVRIIGMAVVAIICISISIWLFVPRITGSHCDTLAGPVVMTAKMALEKGSVDELVKHVTDAVAKGIRERFIHVKETKKKAGKTIEAGREFVEAYVVFTHYVEGIYEAAKKAAHGHQPEHREGEVYKHK